MEIVHLTALADEEGRLSLDVPESMRGRSLRVTVTTEEPISWEDAPRNRLGWPVGFLEHYLGSMPDFPEDPGERDGPSTNVATKSIEAVYDGFLPYIDWALTLRLMN
ncbi:hypothetical protein BH11ARM2_BH11ARM2_32930 [soil metagenome]